MNEGEKVRTKVVLAKGDEVRKVGYWLWKEKA